MIETKRKVGLALSGGAARGFAHIGAIKVLVEAEIPIDFIAGTSAGALVGGMLAAGLSVEEIAELGRGMSWYKLSGFPYSAKGLLSNAPLGEFLESKLPHKNIENLPIPFAAVACNIETGEEFIFRDHGDITTAIRASCAIPGVFVPIEHDGKMLVDGGVVSLVPTRAVRELGADFVIAIDVNAAHSSYFGTPSTFLGVLFQSALMLLRTAGKGQHYHADVVVMPEIGHLRPDELSKLDEFIELGEAATRFKIEEIKNLLKS